MAFANTASLITDFNVDPYYDDFNEEKNFHRILYRPGFAVQGRELTQMQTILQNQIDRFGEHIFKEGSIVYGVEQNYDENYNFIRVQDNAANGFPVTPSDFVGSEITGQTTGLKAIVVNSFDGSQANTPDTKTLYVKYVSSGSNNTTVLFNDGEKLDSNTGLSANALSSNSTGVGSALTVGEGIIFAKDHFVRVPEQTVVISKYNANSDSRIVGFDVSEDIIDSSEDNTLLDPARGSYNFAAPGANRLKLNPILKSLPANTTSANSFVTILDIQSGIVEQKVDKPLYAQIKDYIARRTFDESGNYLVRGLTLQLREHLKSGNNGGIYTSSQGGNNSLLSVEVEPGKAYVQGYDYENIVTLHVPINKGIDTESVEALSVPTNYGNYLSVNELVGNWDLESHDVVSLRDAPANAISNTDYSVTTAVGAEIGTARVRALDYVSGTKGTPDATYRLYLYDITMSSAPFSDVRSVYLNNASISDAKADAVLNTAGDAELNETGFNRAIFEIPASNIKTVRDENGLIDTNFQFYTSFDVTIATDGTFSISTGSSDEQFPFSTGLLNATQKSENFFVTLNAASNTASLSGTVSISSGANTISGSGTSFDTQFNEGDRIKLNSTGEVFTVSGVVGSATLNVLQNAGSTASGSAYTKEFEIGQILDMGGTGIDGSSRTVNITSSTAAEFDTKEALNSSVSATVHTRLNKVDGQEIKKTLRPNRYVIIDISGSSGGTSGPWNLGFSDIYQIREVRQKSGSTFSSASEGTDVTNNFRLNSGQEDNLYDHGRLVKKTASNLSIGGTDFLLVKLDYFAHDTSQGVGYFSVDSYPIDDINTANTNAITTQEIPIYTSASTGESYRLRDSIDIRPRIQDTSADATTVGGASTNPATSTTIVDPGGGLRFSVPNEEYTIDLDYYVGRKDLVILDSSGDFRAIPGEPSLFPVTPNEPAESLVLGKVDIAPYPSLPSNLAKDFDRPELGNKLTPVRTERFRMRDIGVLRDRIDTLEYYTSLSLLEKDTKDLNITDAAGNNRFKNGFLVDNFTGHNIGNVYDPDYNISIDSEKGEARPPFQVINTELNYSAANSSNVQKTGDLITLPYNNVKAMSQKFATTTRNAAGLLWTWKGEIELTPSEDYWVETTNRPDVQVNFDLNTDNWEQLANAWGTQWNDWQTNWTGRRTVDSRRVVERVNLNNNRISERFRRERTVETTERQTRSGTRARVIPETQQYELGNRIVDTSIIPFMRSRNIRFSAVGLKPDTRVYAFFNDEDVNEFITPDGGSEGDNIITDSNGEVSGTFRLPNNNAQRFRVGSKPFRLTDNPTNELEDGLVTTSAETTYSARGTSQVSEETVLSTREPEISFRDVNQRRTTTSTNDISGPGGTRNVGRVERNIINRNITQNIDNSTNITNNVTNVNNITNVRRVTNVRNVSVNRFRGRIIRDRGEGGGGGDPVAQTFKLDNSAIGNISSGAYMTKIDLYFSSKDDNLPITVELREVDAATQYVTNKVIPFSRVTKAASAVNTSTDGKTATTFTFKSPVFLKAGTDYAFVVKPAGGNPNYRVYTARLGDTDLITGNRVIKNPFTGVLFASSNDKTWKSIQNEDIKFDAYLAQFTEIYGGVRFDNQNKDYFFISNVSSAFDRTGEEVDGETTLNLGSSISANVGEFAGGDTSNANGEVTFHSGSTLRVKDVTLNNKYTNSETITLYFANGTPTGASATLSSQSTPTGAVDHYDEVATSNTQLHLSNTNGLFSSGTYIKSQFDGKTAFIDDIKNIRVDVVNPIKGKIIPEGTFTRLRGKFAATESSLQTNFKLLTDNENNETNTSRYLLSRSNEVANLGGAKSGQIEVFLENKTSEFLSPAIDVRRVSLVTVENLINNDSTGEDSVAGGNALARYITRRVTLAEGQDAEDLNVYLTAYNPASATIECYYKILHSEDSDTFDDISWVKMNLGTTVDATSDSEDTEDFKELKYVVPTANLTGPNDEVQYTNSNGVTFTGYKKLAVKVVLLSSNGANPPRIRDFRAIALQV